MSVPAAFCPFRSPVHDFITKPQQHDLLRLFQTAVYAQYRLLSTPKTLTP